MNQDLAGSGPGLAVDEEISDFTPLTAEQAKALALKSPSISPWRVVAWQVIVGTVVALLAWLVTGQRLVGVSAAWGGLAVVLPAALFARGVTGKFARSNVGSAVASFFLWEFVKILVTIAVMYGAHRSVGALSWPAMLAGLVLTMKVYWVALGVRSRPHSVQVETLNGKSN